MTFKVKLIGLILCTLLMDGCANTPPMPPEGHIVPPQPIEGTIPSPVAHSLFPSIPEHTIPREAYAEVYTISVADMPVRDLLYALARDANLNVDIHPKVHGQVTLNIIDQTLPRILERIAQQVDLRFEEEGSTLVVTPDQAYLYTYQVNYLNLRRKVSSGMSLSSQISASSEWGGKQEKNPRGKSTIVVDNISENTFWTTLTENIRSILASNSNQEEQTQTDFLSEKLLLDAAEKADSIQGKKDTSKEINNTLENADFGNKTQQLNQKRNNHMVIANPQSGLITVRATSSQHAEIQLFLDQVMAGARRQVRIEATVVEIRLNDHFQSGVDWTAFRDLASNRSVRRTVLTENTDNQRAEIVTDENAVFAMNLVSPGSGIGNITATINNITAAVRLLEQFGDTQVLSTPKLVALNNQVAILKVVDNEVYFTMEKNEKDDNGNTITTFTSTVHTVPIGLVMNVLPQISPSDEVSLIVRPTITRIVDFVTDPNPDLAKENVVSRVPKIQVREMESMLSVRSGQVAVIGGLMTNVVNKDRDTVPGLSDIPFLGKLFEHRKETTSKTELVIFMRPTVVHSDTDLMESRDIHLLRHSGFSNGTAADGWGVRKKQ